MRLRFVPTHVRGDRRTRKYRLTERDAAQSSGIEATERMKRIAFDRRSFDGLIDEAQIEMGVVTNQHGATAAIFFHGTTDLPKNALQRVAFVDRGS